jgi:hypothetical protein
MVSFAGGQCEFQGRSGSDGGEKNHRSRRKWRTGPIVITLDTTQIRKTPLSPEVFQAGNFRTLDILVFCKERH